MTETTTTTTTHSYRGTGRRKTAIAQVVLKKGTGKITVNELEYNKYFPTIEQQLTVLKPFTVMSLLGRYDVTAVVSGGGKVCQADAVVMGLARALKVSDKTLAPTLRKNGFLTRDSRMKER
ncbi:MAG: 30S ribosomal protein S9 [Planctomycetes bacterium]|nr:30S ribosomal protein S9 [Planctomycetota bacterium]